MPKVKVNDINLYYEIHGKGEPLLLIYGLAGRGRSFCHQIPTLSKQFCTIIFDNRGVGETDQPEGPYTIPQMADDAAALLDALGVGASHIFGISMGGMIAQEFALRHPQRLKKLALGCTHSGIKHCTPSPKWVTEIFKSLAGKPREQAVRESIPFNFSPYTQQNRPDLIEEFVRVMCDNSQSAYAYQLQINAIYAFDTYDRLPQIAAPTLLLSGIDDVLIPPANSLSISERIPDSRLLEFENAGHLFFVERAPDVNSTLEKFFKSG
jgi:pimeloyl-ACP methyl ester carboxylesterase